MDREIFPSNVHAETEVSRNTHVSGSVLSVPGKGLSGYAGELKAPADPQSDWTSAARTTDHAGRCATQVISPDGTKYKFGRHAFRLQEPMHIPARYTVQSGAPFESYTTLVVSRRFAVYLITEVEDIHGNWVRYDYSNNNRAELTRIHSNDGREIELFYNATLGSHSNSRTISHITANGRRWDYEYAGDANVKQRLHKAVLPDGRYWEFADTAASGARDGLGSINHQPHPYYKCVPFVTNFNVTHPDGAVAEFRLRETRHIKNAVRVGYQGDDEHYIAPRTIPHYTNNTECQGTKSSNGNYIAEYTHERPHGWPVFQAMSVVEKKISGANIPTATWDFEYRDYSGGPIDNNWTIITGPDGTERTYTYQAVGFDRGLLKSIDVVPSSGAGETITYEHDQDGDGASGGTYGWCRADGENPLINAGNCQTYKKRPVTKTIHQRDGDTYTTEYDYDFSVAASPISVSKYSSRWNSTTPRVRVTTFEDKTSNWILDLPKTVTTNGREQVRAYYNNLGQLTSYEKYGQKVYDYTYNSDGTLASITDALLRKTQAFSWKRGTPQHVKRAVGTVDEVNQYQYVDDNGWLTSSIDGNNNTTSYDHDIMGRMTKITPPSGWTHTDIDYDFSSGGAVQTITKGQGITTVTYDRMYRPRLERTQALDTGWSSYVNTEYDASGRVTFQSQPSASATESKGVDTTYDGLGRVYNITENVAPYAQTKHRYYSDHRHRIYDPSGAFTQYYSYGYDGPGNKDYSHIYRYSDGVYRQKTILHKNIWGQLTRLRQFGSHDGVTKDLSQYFYYDSKQRLCGHYVPEHATTKYEYDAARQMTGYAKGQPNSTCSAIDSATALVSLEYDDLGRVIKTDFKDPGTPDITRTYDDNGNVLTVNRGTGGSAVNWTYAYNDANLLTHEYLDIDGKNFDSSYVYNASGFLTQKNQPNNQVINYTVDSLGRMMKIKDGTATLASGINFHESGNLHQMQYGNGQYFSQILNERLLPERLLSYKGGSKAIDQTLGYDARGLITSIVDGAVSGNNRTYSYDGLGYLKTASGPWGAGSYSYDSLGNLRSKQLGSRTVGLTYDAAKNRVTQSADSGPSGTRAIAYDTRGNVTTLGNLGMAYDMSDQPIAVTGTANGIGSANGTYRYDGNFKRVKSIINDGNGPKTIYNVYDAAGSLVHIDKHSDGENTDYVSGPMGTLARITNGTVTYLHPDHLGSAQAGTNSSGLIAWREQYTPFGEQLQDPAANDNLDGFTGHIKDKATGLNYMQARYYDPVIGRLLSIDPVTMLDMDMNPEYFNRYSYTSNDPVNAIDPNGESTLSIGGSVTISKPKFIGDPNINIVKVGLKFSVSLPVPILDPTAEFDTGVSATIGGGGGKNFGLKGSLDGSAGPGSVKDLAGRSLEGEVHIIAAGGAVSTDVETGELSEVTASIGPGVSVAVTEDQTFTLSLRNGFLSD